ncbi:uncharacterized protein LOC129598147 [Paramacrobiotus metropolitanus]|uniref:uncharacterized protein LOC129598147 n=1 Tax=Paramacrobiotus metropolitanus TaxID=2943436 RepID=UPI00244566FE|nr:uncharacterized protein LOC129598147 [Paramacrobiotus metropolitanus]XP_055351889.1 uncharacterized protein LOC129598147 [Paramacrobiotus metropolitanus]XP_055351890.1 uncharacterized protein LOC129598147 [Paramacrobiotus metropolitanus]
MDGFPELHRLAIQGGRIFLTGKELRMLQTLNAVAVKFSAYPTEQQFLNALGVKYYRLLYTMEATVFDYGDIAALLEKMSAPAKFIADVALPEEHFRPKVLRKLQDSTEYVTQWVRPFAAGGKFDVVQAILERLDLAASESRWTSKHRMLCTAPAHIDVRNAGCIPLESKKEYYVLCALCGLKVDWNKMEQHVRTRHNKARWEVCRRCWAPTDGPHAQDIPHCVVCPLSTKNQISARSVLMSRLIFAN